MADLYPPSYLSRSTPSYQRHNSDSTFHSSSSASSYPQPITTQHSGGGTSSNASSDDGNDQPPSPTKSNENQAQKPEAKPQATFLTKLYALLERPENHHMIRWDPQGEHIIVERPEQLALHVLPSVYRQSRFASFSRQLNIYGFMRKVNLRNVDPAIDDPDASTWSHPTLNRHSPPEVVANFKRRVPPRLPKPRKRDLQDPAPIPPPRSAVGMNMPLALPPSNVSLAKPNNLGRARGFSAPGSYNPMNQGSSGNWGNQYPRTNALPPLTVPNDPPMSHSMYNSPLVDETPSSSSFGNISTYPPSNRDMMVSSSQYQYPDQNNWSMSNNGASSNHGGSLSSLLNPSSTGYGRPTPTINTSYAAPFSSMTMTGEHSASSLSPDSRPNTGYSMSSVSSLPYADDHLHQDYSRPGSSHHRPISPIRPHSSRSSYNTSLSVRRTRRHSQTMSPYPSPYDHGADHQRPSTSPQPIAGDPSATNGIQRVRSMIQLPSVDSYGAFAPPQAEFAYAGQGMDSMHDGGWSHRNVMRPSTSASSVSAASHTSSTQAHTPPATDYHGETDINRFSPDFGFVPMNEHVPQHYSKAGELH